MKTCASHLTMTFEVPELGAGQGSGFGAEAKITSQALRPKLSPENQNLTIGSTPVLP